MGGITRRLSTRTPIFKEGEIQFSLHAIQLGRIYAPISTPSKPCLVTAVWTVVTKEASALDDPAWLSHKTILSDNLDV